MRTRKRKHAELEAARQAPDEHTKLRRLLEMGRLEEWDRSPSPENSDDRAETDLTVLNASRRASGYEDHTPAQTPESAHHAATAWETLCAYSATVRERFPRTRPTPKHVAELLDLPAVRQYINNPLAKGGLGFAFKSLGQEQVVENRRLKGALVQVTGDIEGRPCGKCAKGNGFWIGCVVPAGQERGGRTTCANCSVSGNNSRCTWN